MNKDELRNWVIELLQPALARRQEIRSEMVDLDRLIHENSTSQRYPNASNINIPLIRSQVKAIKSRLFQALFGQTPAVRIRPVSGISSSLPNPDRVGVAATQYFEFAHKRRDELNARNVLRKCIYEFVAYGRCWFKVIPVNVNGYSGPRWFFVSYGDMLFPEGLGDDVDALPYIGQVYYLSNEEAKKRSTFDKKVLDKVLLESDDQIRAELDELFHNSNLTTASFIENNRNRYAEIWTRIDGREVVLDVHLNSLEIIGPPRPVNMMRRPYFTAAFEDVGPMSLSGIGVPRELEALQKITNALYNGTVDSIDVALRHVKLIRHGSMLCDVLGSGERADGEKLEILPNMVLPTENTEADMQIIPLGNPAAAGHALQMTALLQQNAYNMEGIGAAQMGNVGVTQRAPATGVASVMAEGSFPIRDATIRLAEAFQDAVLHTFDIYATAAPDGRPYQVLGDNGEVLQKVFQLDKKASEVFSIEVDVADPAKSDDAAQQRALLRAQFVMSWNEKLAQILPGLYQMNASPQMMDAMREIMSKSVELMRRVLEVSAEVQDPESLLVDVDKLLSATGTQPQPPQPPQQAPQAALPPGQGMMPAGGLPGDVGPAGPVSGPVPGGGEPPAEPGLESGP